MAQQANPLAELIAASTAKLQDLKLQLRDEQFTLSQARSAECAASNKVNETQRAIAAVEQALAVLQPKQR